jgi:hypothetical protein
VRDMARSAVACRRPILESVFTVRFTEAHTCPAT